MAVNSKSENTVLRLWLLLRRVGDVLMLCQDSVFSEYNLTTEQWGVLTSLKSRGPLRPSDLSLILERTPNSMSMLIDRMVKAGLVNEVLSPLSHDDQHTLASLLETVKCELDSSLHPEIGKAEIIRDSFTNDPDLYKRMVNNLLPPGYEVKRKHREK